MLGSSSGTENDTIRMLLTFKIILPIGIIQILPNFWL